MYEEDNRTAELRRQQSLLQQREREIVEDTYLRRIHGFESIRDASRRLAELGSSRGILVRAAAEFGVNSRFDRVLISEVRDDLLTPRILWQRDDARAEMPAAFKLSYPMVEHEVAEQRETTARVVLEGASRTPPQLLRRFKWVSYGVGAIVADGRAIGLFHADADRSGRTLDDVDRELISFSCEALGELFERVSLRETLQRHRAELQSAASWLGDRLRATSAPRLVVPKLASDTGELVSTGSLTLREREVLSLLARGQTNGQIAAKLLIQEGTVKYHVKNILRKLGARSRADAVARFARATGETPQ